MITFDSSKVLVIRSVAIGAIANELIDALGDIKRYIILCDTFSEIPTNISSDNVKFIQDVTTWKTSVLVSYIKQNYPLAKNMIVHDAHDMDSRFDSDYYMELYPDVVSGGYNKPSLAYKHWIMYGQYEGRVCCNTNDGNTLNDQRKINSGIQETATSTAHTFIDFDISDKSLPSDWFDWQVPNSTELDVSNEIKKHNLPPDVEYISFPWACVVDVATRFKTNIHSVLKKCNIPSPKISKNKVTITTFQSYRIWKYLPELSRYGINVIYSPHAEKIKSVDFYYKYNVLVLPIMLKSIMDPSFDIKSKIKKIKHLPVEKLEQYPVYHKIKDYLNDEKIDITSDSTYDISFIGTTTYGPQDVTCNKIRKLLVEILKTTPRSNVHELDEWHLNNEVYGRQLGQMKYNHDKQILQTLNEIHYHIVMHKSSSVACPVGVGPNSFRVSESFMYNKHPVIISDNLWLPEEISSTDYTRIKYSDMELLKDIVVKKQIKPSESTLNAIRDLSVPIKNFTSSEHYTLCTVLYSMDTNSDRYAEISYAVKRNINNKYIDRVIIFFETNFNNTVSVADVKKLYPVLNNKKVYIRVVPVHKRKGVSINMMMDYINHEHYGKKIIITNSDIYFDHTIDTIKKSKLIINNEVVCLTRTNMTKTINNVPVTYEWSKHSKSQDSWIYVSPKRVPDTVINLGWIRSDNKLCYSFYKNGYNLSNPSEHVFGWHCQSRDNTETNMEFSHGAAGDGTNLGVPFTSVHQIVRDYTGQQF